jgi:glutamate 5-kinase
MTLIRTVRPTRLTVVIGTSSIVDETTHEPILSILSLIVETAIKLRRDGHRVLIVSSGAIGVGLQRMNMSKRPKHLSQVQVRLDLLKVFDTAF